MATITPIEYTGLIFCPTVSTGAFVARRNSKVFVTGNSGFPKSHDVSKAIDKAAGAKREVIGPPTRHAGQSYQWGDVNNNPTHSEDKAAQTAPATDEAREWQGWGTALKPAWEPIIVARKPLEGTVAENVLKYGTGAMNIDGCRIGTSKRHPGNYVCRDNAVCLSLGSRDRSEFEANEGRWPANVIHDGSEEVVELFPANAGASAPVKGHEASTPGQNGIYGHYNRVAGPFHGDSGSAARFFYCAKASPEDIGDDTAVCPSLDGSDQSESNNNKGRWPANVILDKRAGEILDEQSGPSKDGTAVNRNRDGEVANRILGPRRALPGEDVTFGGGGGASRFFYCAKASRKDRGDGNDHPTVKPTSLMAYLVKLVTRENALILDPFCGSGSTGVAALRLGRRFIGIDSEAKYTTIADKRLKDVRKVGEEKGE